MTASQLVESYRFWDVVALWAKELLEHEDVVASALARGVIRDGLRFLSVDPKWLKQGKTEVQFRGYPNVGYCAKPDGQMIVLSVATLQHLLSIVERAEKPSRELLYELFVSREDFLDWLRNTKQPLPFFWFGSEE